MIGQFQEVAVTSSSGSSAGMSVGASGGVGISVGSDGRVGSTMGSATLSTSWSAALTAGRRGDLMSFYDQSVISQRRV